MAVTPELRRQYRREVDLAKILAKLYARYSEVAVAERRMTTRDAIGSATRRCAPMRLAERRLRRRIVALSSTTPRGTDRRAAVARENIGPGLAGVTLCGDPASERTTRPLSAFRFGSSTALPPAIEIACRRLSGENPFGRRDVEPRPPPAPRPVAREEAAFVAGASEWVERGTPPTRIAVFFRSIGNIEMYEAALLDRNVPIVTAGDVNVSPIGARSTPWLCYGMRTIRFVTTGCCAR